MALKSGDWVEVRSKEEILQTLDRDGRLDGMPFMPQMFKYCGTRFKVLKRAHKTCDPVYSIAGRSLPNAVHLNLRCDGLAHGGCNVGCLLFWKEAWLKPVEDSVAFRIPRVAKPNTKASAADQASCTEEDVWAGTRRAGESGDANDVRYVCQTTQLCEFTKPLAWWHMSQYVEDYRSGNITLLEWFRGVLYAGFGRPFGQRLRFARHLYDGFQKLTGGPPLPIRKGTVEPGTPTPIATLSLKTGDLVRVKSHEQILATLDRRNTNRGLFFDVEMVPFCGRVFRVRTPVERFIDEKNGRMKSLKTPAVILENVFCQSRYSSCRLFCPRALHSWWREVWLERVPEGDAASLASSTFATASDEAVGRRTTAAVPERV